VTAAAGIDEFYESMRTGFRAMETPFADGIGIARPEVDRDQPPYEGMASANETAKRELLGAEEEFMSRAVWIREMLLGVMVGLGLESKEERHKGFTITVVRPTAEALPDLTNEREAELLTMAAGLCAYTKALEPHLRDACATIIRLHRLITLSKPARNDVQPQPRLS
jgi:hypothetical protein